MAIVISIQSGNNLGGRTCVTTVRSTTSGVSVESRSADIGAALDSARETAFRMATKEVGMAGHSSIQTIVDGEEQGFEIVGDYVENDITPEDEDETPTFTTATEEEEAVIEAKEIGTDIISEAFANESVEEDVIAGHEDVVEPARESDVPKLSVKQDGKKIVIEIEAEEDFTLWRKIGNKKAGSRSIDAGSSEISYVGNLDEAVFRINDEEGILLFP